ncbi:class II glutamine amidotransferase [Rhodoferax sp.]|uniref:class II glutamine amidotransferase n=1 Tax=Rhodoferax sp. TaxID=50421 RepID=UPI00374DC70B
MCELLAISTSEPAQLTFSLKTLAARGSAKGHVHDGWGVAFYQGADVALFREPLAAGDSPLVRYLETDGPSTRLGISHIRHATLGSVQFANTQPFLRELGGHSHVFAHNGTLLHVEASRAMALGSYRPVGQTDSEYAFCVLMARMHSLWADASPPPLQARMDLLASFAADMRALGPANFLYADGDTLFAHGHRRIHDDGEQAEPPGLWMLQRVEMSAEPPPAHQDGVAVEADAEKHDALLIASVALTDEAWRPLAEGELVAVRHGKLVAVHGQKMR